MKREETISLLIYRKYAGMRNGDYTEKAQTSYSIPSMHRLGQY